MSKREPTLLLNDITNSIQKIQSYTQGMLFDEFIQDDKTTDAVIRNFEVIGEASNQLPAIFCEQHPQIAWRRMADFRNVLIHKYFGVDLQLVWEIIQYDLPELRKRLESLNI
ncbi:MAG: DUF86 domain-containing protein [Thiotrichaceae bacterium]|nr:DUF86 domain-containing protein [Thiotrichaceae bacterium]